METQVKLFIENDHKQNQQKMEQLQASHQNELMQLQSRIESQQQTITKQRQDNEEIMKEIV